MAFAKFEVKESFFGEGVGLLIGCVTEGRLRNDMACRLDTGLARVQSFDTIASLEEVKKGSLSALALMEQKLSFLENGADASTGQLKVYIRATEGVAQVPSGIELKFEKISLTSAEKAQRKELQQKAKQMEQPMTKEQAELNAKTIHLLAIMMPMVFFVLFYRLNIMFHLGLCDKLIKLFQGG